MCESSSVSPSVSPSRSFDRRLLYRDVVFVRMLLINDDIVTAMGRGGAVSRQKTLAMWCTLPRLCSGNVVGGDCTV